MAGLRSGYSSFAFLLSDIIYEVMETIIYTVAALLIFLVPSALVFFLKERKRKKVFDALSEQEKQRHTEQENYKVKSAIVLLFLILTGALGKAGISWPVIITISAGLFAALWLLTKVFSRKKQ